MAVDTFPWAGVINQPPGQFSPSIFPGTGNDFISGLNIGGTINSYVAAGASQATGVPITTSTAVITSGTGGVTLPASGFVSVVVMNRTGSTINLWPNLGAKIETASINAAWTLANNATALMVQTSATQWWSS